MDSLEAKLRARFPRASKSFIEANADKLRSGDDEIPDKKPKQLRHGAPQPNQTEREFGAILAAQQIKTKILRYKFQGVTLLWGDGMRYTPDWWVTTGLCKLPDGRVYYSFKAIEVKGAKIWDRDIVRFKGAKAEWTEFDFEMWQKKEGRWNRLL